MSTTLRSAPADSHPVPLHYLDTSRYRARWGDTFRGCSMVSASHLSWLFSVCCATLCCRRAGIFLACAGGAANPPSSGRMNFIMKKLR